MLFLLYVEKDILYKYFVELSAHKISYLAVFTFLYTIVQCLILFYANFFISIFIGKIKFISNIGSSSLYLCGNETMVKNLLVFVLGLFGVNFVARGPILAPNIFICYNCYYPLHIYPNRKSNY